MIVGLHLGDAVQDLRLQHWRVMLALVGAFVALAPTTLAPATALVELALHILTTVWHVSKSLEARIAPDTLPNDQPSSWP